jgi:hypothetical protein
MLAEEIKKELKEKEDEFHIHQPRKLFLDYIGKIIRQKDEHEAKIYDLRGNRRIILLRELHNLPIGDLLDKYVRDKGTTMYNLNLTVDDFINTANFFYEKGRMYLRGYNLLRTTKVDLDITDWNLTQAIIISDEMLEDRMKILKEEGFIVEEKEEKQNHRPDFKDWFFALTRPEVTFHIFLVKLPE